MLGLAFIKDRERESRHFPTPIHTLSTPVLRRPLAEAAAARLVLLGLDVVVDLELGLVWLLRRSVLQLPGRETERGGEGRGEHRKLAAEGVDV